MPDDSHDIAAMRHSTAHLLAAAVLRLWPDTKLAIGPAIQDGFYYDFQFTTPISEAELLKIEKMMKKTLVDWKSFDREDVSIAEAKERQKDQPFKLELIEEFSKDAETVSFYTSGRFTDLCRGGHIENPQDIGPFKLLKVAGAYWRGDEKNPQLTRIYGTVFANQEELDAYLTQQEEAKKRDHKKLGKELDLFTFSELVGSGLPLWTPKGTQLRNTLDDFVWQLRKARGFQKVEIPHITKKELYEKSGHWNKFKDELFRIKTREGHEFAMKPMNCPHHTQIYDRVAHSYRELPIRYANTTMVYRDEQTGELAGLSRVRSITQDDAHVFCRYSQIEQEANAIWDIIDEFYRAVGFEKLECRLSLHDPKEPDKYMGDKKLWEQAEESLRQIVKKRAKNFIEAEGEAAFYGPKIDFMARDAIGRELQVATIQLDMNQPEGFDLTCINEKGEKERIVMIHCAIMGSLERFIAVIIEHFAGAFPLWLAPVQVKVLPISDKHLAFAQKVRDQLLAADIRVELDDANETIGAKIRKATKEKIPYQYIVGDKEIDASGASDSEVCVSVRARDGKDLGQNRLADVVHDLHEKIKNKSLSQ